MEKLYKGARILLAANAHGRCETSVFPCDGVGRDTHLILNQ